VEPWINNRRALNATVKRMMEISKHALALTLRAKSKAR
jgi:stress-induced morphogen